MQMMQQFKAGIAATRLQEKIRQFAAHIDALGLRERVLLLCAAVITLFILSDTFGLQPALEQQEQSKLAISDWQRQLAELQIRSGLLSGQSDNDPAQLRELRREQLRAELSDIDDSLMDRFGALLEPEQAVQVLKQVLEQEQGLRLSEAIAVSKVDAGPTPDDANAAPVSGIGRYELQLQLEGSYLATLRYLHALESLPWKFFWDEVNFEVVEYPTARVRIDLHTLGLPG